MNTDERSTCQVTRRTVLNAGLAALAAGDLAFPALQQPPATPPRVGVIWSSPGGGMLHVSYTGVGSTVLRYHRKGAHVNHGEHWCISFGGLRVDEAVASEVLHAISGNAVEAAPEAAEQMRQQRQEQRTVLQMEGEQARYEAHLASRPFEAVDPDMPPRSRTRRTSGAGAKR